MNIQNMLPEIPNFITEEWLRNALKNQIFSIWGFSFSDLSNCTFDKNIDESVLNRVVISSKTKLPKEHPFNINLTDYIDNDIKNLNDMGITGEGINIAIIDQDFDETHDEINGAIKEHISLNDREKNNFHGLCVSSNLVGKNFGVAPKSNVIFYGFQPYNKETIRDASISALENIYKRNLNGEGIRLVSISGYLHTESPKFEDIKQKLASQNCYIIDSPTFGQFFTSINLRQNNGTKNYNYSNWQLEYLGGFKKKIAIPYTGVTPLVNSTSDYTIGGDVTYSWVIPRLTGIIALCMQLKPDMTLDEFGKIALDTKYTTEDGKNIINPSGIVKTLSLECSEKPSL